VIFPSTAGTLRDPDNFNKQWRTVRDQLGAPDVTSHSFRKSVATLIDDDGLSARIGAGPNPTSAGVAPDASLGPCSSSSTRKM